MSATICKLCGLPIDAIFRNHLIPDFANRIIRENMKGHLRLLWVARGQLVKQLAGIYEVGLFCRRCEDRFGAWEAAVGEFVRQDPSTWARIEGPDSTGVSTYRVSQNNYAALKLFTLSIAYRLAASTRPEGRSLRLNNATRDALAVALRKSDPGPTELFPALVLRYLPSKKLAGAERLISVGPVTRAGDSDVFYFSLAGFKFAIGVGATPLPTEMMAFALRPAQCLILEGPFDDSTDDRAAALGVARSAAFVHPDTRR